MFYYLIGMLLIIKYISVIYLENLYLFIEVSFYSVYYMWYTKAKSWSCPVHPDAFCNVSRIHKEAVCTSALCVFSPLLSEALGYSRVVRAGTRRQEKLTWKRANCSIKPDEWVTQWHGLWLSLGEGG